MQDLAGKPHRPAFQPDPHPGGGSKGIALNMVYREHPVPDPPRPLDFPVGRVSAPVQTRENRTKLGFVSHGQPPYPLPPVSR